MKRLILTIFLVLFLAGSLNAAPITGSWDLGSGLQNGGWYEIFTGGGHGAVGNQLTGYGDSTPLNSEPAQWLYQGYLQGVTPSGKAGYQWQTTYSGFMELDAAGPWGEAILLNNVKMVNDSILTTENGVKRLQFAIGGSKNMNGYLYSFSAMYDSTEYGQTADGSYVPLALMTAEGHDGTYDAHLSDWTMPAFDSATLEISQVPVPAAVWLLGSGLAGLFGLRRRMRK